MSNTSILQKILYRIDNDDKVSSSNIIEKFKSELQQHDVDMYNAWEDDEFNINANSFGGSNLLCLAFENGYTKVVEFLIEKEVDVNVRDNEGKTPLHLAVSSSSLDMIGVPIVIRGLIDGDGEGENVNVQDSIVDVLIGKGANVNIQDNEGKTPLHLAVSNSEFPNLFAVVSLIMRGAEVNVQDNEGKTPLHPATSYIVSSIWGTKETKEENVKMLLDKGAEVSIQDNEGRTPLHLAVSTPGQRIQIAEMLLNKGAEVDIRDNEGKTPLHLAASCSNSLCKHFVEMLLKNGAEINIRDNEGKTPLDYAISSEREDVVKVLTEKTILPDEEASLMLSEHKAVIDSQDQYENDFPYPLFF